VERQGVERHCGTRWKGGRRRPIDKVEAPKLDDNYDHSSADAQQPAAQVGAEAQALHPPEKADSEHGKLTARDPNIVGFVPAYILGNVYMCKLPDRYSMLPSIYLLRLSIQSIAHQSLYKSTNNNVHFDR